MNDAVCVCVCVFRVCCIVVCVQSVLYRGVCSECVPCLECLEHCLREGIRIIFAGEVESVHLSVVPPLVEGGRGLVVLESL